MDGGEWEDVNVDEWGEGGRGCDESGDGGVVGGTSPGTAECLCVQKSSLVPFVGNTYLGFLLESGKLPKGLVSFPALYSSQPLIEIKVKKKIGT